MLNNFKNEDFERFLKGSADGLRMRPSDAVWTKINARMNRRRRGVVITSAIFLLTASLFGYYLVDSAKSLDDPMATTNIIKERSASTPTINSNQNTVTNSKEVYTGRNNNTTNRKQSNSNSSITNNINSLFIPALVAALPLLEPITGTETSITQLQNSDLEYIPTLVDEYEPPAPATESASKASTSVVANPYPQTIESVVNQYKRKFKSPKTELQFLFTPTVSYRRLTENKSFLRQVPNNSTTFINAMRNNVNNVVDHKPALGLEIGMAFKYRVSNNLKLRTGLQLNVSRYDIKAVSSYLPELATIALNNTSGVDSINTMTRFRNVTTRANGDWLKNSYLQVSMPVGAELRLFGNKNTHVGIATTVQPTYVLGNQAYLISTDYKTYSQVPSLTRRWNVHTAVETYVGYSTGKLNWQIGPQVRYQLLSSFDSKYPVKENLFDFGLKVGISLNKQ